MIKLFFRDHVNPAFFFRIFDSDFFSLISEEKIIFHTYSLRCHLSFWCWWFSFEWLQKSIKTWYQIKHLFSCNEPPQQLHVFFIHKAFLEVLNQNWGHVLKNVRVSSPSAVMFKHSNTSHVNRPAKLTQNTMFVLNYDGVNTLLHPNRISLRFALLVKQNKHCVTLRLNSQIPPLCDERRGTGTTFSDLRD